MTQRLPGGDRADIPPDKLLSYCLNPEHPSGKHKARVFASVLGITQANSEVLQELIKFSALEGNVIQQSTTDFGQIFKVDWQIPETDVILRTIWEIKSDSLSPRLVSAFIK